MPKITMAFVSTHKTIGIIGTGNLGKSLMTMFHRRKAPMICSVRDNDRLRLLREKFCVYDVKLTADNTRIASEADVLILSVKPTQIKNVCRDILSNLSSDTIVISAAAAIPLSSLHYWLPHSEVIIRCIPNVPCSVGKGIVPYYTHSEVGHKIMAETFAPNMVLPLETDEQMDAATIISGCGPAFFSWYQDCLRNVGSNVIDPDLLTTMITQTMVGTAALLEKESSYDIIKAVASPGGATQATLELLYINNIHDEIKAAFATAKRRINSIVNTLNQ